MRKRKEERTKRKRNDINYLWSLCLILKLINQLPLSLNTIRGYYRNEKNNFNELCPCNFKLRFYFSLPRHLQLIKITINKTIWNGLLFHLPSWRSWSMNSSLRGIFATADSCNLSVDWLSFGHAPLAMVGGFATAPDSSVSSGVFAIHQEFLNDRGGGRFRRLIRSNKL